jgi:3-methyladenine DNA glycosylase AlkD
MTHTPPIHTTKPFAAALIQGMAAIADPTKAPAMQRYMKTTQPFWGITSPDRRAVLKETKKQFKHLDRAQWLDAVQTLWKGPQRETQYMAIDVAHAWGRWLEPADLRWLKVMIEQGAWWDLVDPIATQPVSQLLKTHRAIISPEMDRWIIDPSLWVRRAALLSQLPHKNLTDTTTLFDHIRRCAHEKEFFIRKAIGWALRQYARTNPDAVRAFITDMGDALSPLSRREATKHL